MANSRYPTIAAGDLNRVVAWRAFQAGTGVVDAFGRQMPQFADMGQHYARVRPLTGAGLVVAMQVKFARYSEVTMRIVGDVKPLDEIVYDGRTLTVVNVVNWDESGVYFTLHVAEEPLNPSPLPS